MKIHTVKIYRTVQIECNGDPLVLAKRMVTNPDDWEFWLRSAASDIPISELNLPWCMVKHLRDLGFTAVDKLAQLTESELGWHNKYGYAALDELREKLRVLGFKFQTKEQ